MGWIVDKSFFSLEYQQVQENEIFELETVEKAKGKYSIIFPKKLW